MAYPNPFNVALDKPLNIDFTATRSVVTARIKIYTAAYRLVRNVVMDTSGMPGYVTGNVAASYLRGLASGVYYYVIEAVGNSGEQAHSGVNKIIILK
jgi:hypothetical protein